MTSLSRILAFFPLFHGLSTAALGLMAISRFSHSNLSAGGVWTGACLTLLYLVPPALFRLHAVAFPLEEGFSRIDSQAASAKYSPWWGGHQLQGLFIAFPALECWLRLIPGAYSAWLRLWGAKMGRGIYWTPRVEILDRSMIEIGDGVIFGHDAALCSHVVIKKRESIRLYVKKIVIGSYCLIGAQSKLGPGVRIADRTDLPYGSIGKINERIAPGLEVAAHE
jgi:hypothetical protein